MVRVITQETFDNVVKENEDDLEMSHEEAVQDAIKQFEAQGVDLTNIITSGSKEDSSSEHAIIKTLKRLVNILESPVENINPSDLQDILTNLKGECDIDIARKVLAGKNRAYPLLVDTLEKFEDNHDIVHLTLTALTSLMTGQPDLLDEQGIRVIMRCLKKENDLIKQQTLRWARQCCIKHEENRQLIMELEVGQQIHDLLPGAPPVLVRHACMTIRSLVLDDDIRVPFGKAHEHARLLASHKEDQDTVNELLSTLGSLVVREEFCREVEECGGVAMIMDIMVTYPDDEKLNRQCLKLIKGLAGSDQVKVKIVQAGIIPLLISAMVRHQSSIPLFSMGALSVAAIALRSPSNSQLLCDAGAAEALLQGMREHAKDASCQLSKEFLDAGAEELLRATMATHGTKCDTNAKDALRDLGCSVQLTERWTGKGGGISQ
ncbi:hypothetical protein B566_EDAN001949 [Ephemera danica]|nr:hypothetical protein B566_EDAN001949 [Ephemera danica]